MRSEASSNTLSQALDSPQVQTAAMGRPAPKRDTKASQLDDRGMSLPEEGAVSDLGVEARQAGAEQQGHASEQEENPARMDHREAR